MRKFKFWLSRNFGFNNREINGLSVLVIIIMLMLALVLTFQYWYPAPVYEVKIEQYFIERPAVSEDATAAETAASPRNPVNEQPFDPNSASAAVLESYGIPAFLSARIVNYREKGGVFRQKKDLLKIYDFPEELYTQLEDRILIPQTQVPNVSTRELAKPGRESGAVGNESIASGKPFNTSVPIDINTDDTLAWQALKGIGPVYSARIVRYKNDLGGFKSIAQLYEVFALPEEVIAENQMHLTIDPDFEPRKLSLSASDIKQLAAHPYISYGLAKVLKAYEQQHAPLDSIGQLRNIEILNDEKYSEIAPYLSL